MIRKFLFMFVSFFVFIANANERLAPFALSETAERYDLLYYFLIVISTIASLMVILGFIYLAFKYRRQDENQKTAYITHNNMLEFLWSFIPLVLFLVVFVWGWSVYHDMRTFPKDSFEIHVTGQKWNWNFEYKSGRVPEIGEFYVPANRPIKLIMTSKDVIHSFFIPALRIKQDTVPGMYTALGFTARTPGLYQVFCAEYCGQDHWNMSVKMRVLTQEKFDRWIETGSYEGGASQGVTTTVNMIEKGEKLYKFKCMSCHSVTGKKIIGPSFKGLFGSKRLFNDGTSAIADENYIRTSIAYPNKQVVKGFVKGQMPVQQLTEQQTRQIIEYIKSLK